MSEEALRMYAELTQQISLCQDEDIKKLGEGIIVLADNYDKSKKEIERLNKELDYVASELNKCQDKILDLENIIKEVREKIENFDVFKEFTFPLMKKWEEQEVKSSIDYEWNQSIKKPILEMLDKLHELKGSDKY